MAKDHAPNVVPTSNYYWVFVHTSKASTQTLCQHMTYTLLGGKLEQIRWQTCVCNPLTAGLNEKTRNGYSWKFVWLPGRTETALKYPSRKQDQEKLAKLLETNLLTIS